MKRGKSTPRAKAIKRNPKSPRHKAKEIAFDALRDFVLVRDGGCVLCGARLGDWRNGRRIIFQCSHFFSRAKESTAWDTRNAYCQCKSCHMSFHKVNSKPYNDFIRSKLGQEQLDALELFSNQVAKYTVDDILEIAYNLKQRRLELEGNRCPTL